MESNFIHVYADGACKGNPGVGGWGAAISADGVIFESEYCGGELNTTNNRMELAGVIVALENIPSGSSIKVHTDSKYVQQGMKEWLPSWKKKGWKTSGGGVVKNVDLWQRLDAIALKHKVEWIWVKGHNGNLGNELADKLANQGVEQVLKQ